MANANMRILTWVAVVLVIVGGINWGLVGLFGLDLISGTIGHGLARLVFIIVGVAAGYLIYLKVMKKIVLQVI
jgi:uncharacterized membrane protein YuzA (DUF378 family)